MISLTELIQNVHAEEQTNGYVNKTSLLQIAQYILDNAYKYPIRYTETEYNDAVIVLAKYHLAQLLDIHHRSRVIKLIQLEAAKHYESRCGRCGAPISSKKSLETGLGVICRKKTLGNKVT